MNDQSLWEILNAGGYAMWVIVLFSVLAVAVAIERAAAQWKFTQRARTLADTVSRCLVRGAVDEGRSACERSPSPLADIFLAGYERLGRTKPEHLANAVHRERVRVASDLKSRLWMLGTIGATAPFVGLFGTVVGIMQAFADIDESGQSGFNVVAGPISHALIVTAAGILVAVEAVIIYNFFNQRLARIALELKMLTEEFLELLIEAPDKDTAPASTDGGGAADKKTGKKDKKADGDREAA